MIQTEIIRPPMIQTRAKGTTSGLLPVQHDNNNNNNNNNNKLYLRLWEKHNPRHGDKKLRNNSKTQKWNHMHSKM